MSTRDLFSNDNDDALVVTITETLSRPLTAAQKKFNANIKKIEQQKALLAHWQATSEQCQQDYVSKLQPLHRAFAEQQEAMVRLLDNLYTSHKFTHIQQEKIVHLICETAIELINRTNSDDMKAIYNRYQTDDGGDFDAQEDVVRSMIEEELGISLAGIDINDAEAIAQKLFEQQEAMQQQAQDNRAQRRKSAKQLAKEAKEQEEQTGMSKSLQAVYRQLVAALHPDREKDNHERERKTAIMQEVTVAYEKKDLLKLLELQLATEQIDQHNLANIAEDRLKHYNKVLDRQLRELKEETQDIEMHFRAMLSIPSYEPLTPKRLTDLFKRDAQHLQHSIERIQEDLRFFKQDVKHLKNWLKDYHIELNDDRYI
jgi:hypothetical protein